MTEASAFCRAPGGRGRSHDSEMAASHGFRDSPAGDFHLRRALVVAGRDRLEVPAHVLEHPDHGLLFLPVHAREEAALKSPTPLLHLGGHLLAVLGQRHKRESVVGGVEPAVDRLLRFELLDEARLASRPARASSCSSLDVRLVERRERRQLYDT